MRGVVKRYGRTGPLVIDHLDLTVADGSLAVIHGSNGCGKSTVLRLAGGFLPPTSGRIDRTPGTFGYLPDRAVPPSRLTAGSYLTQLARLAGSPESAARGLAITERLGLTPGPSVPLGTLSRGNLQKVLLAQALMRPALLVILDEPFTGLDADATTALRAVIAERLAEGCAFLIADHEDHLDELGASFTLEDAHLRRAE
jgi:ABC-type multidrug transport system ATPase subunit